jgi:hypothetical protein
VLGVTPRSRSSRRRRGARRDGGGGVGALANSALSVATNLDTLVSSDARNGIPDAHEKSRISTNTRDRAIPRSGQAGRGDP